MSRSLSSAALRAIAADETAEELVILVRLTHSSLEDPVLVARHTEDLVRADGTWTAIAMDITLPGEVDGETQSAQITIDNVSRELIDALRAASREAPVITMLVVLASSPDSEEYPPVEMRLAAVGYDAVTITGELGFPPILEEPYPGRRYTPDLFPGLFDG